MPAEWERHEATWLSWPKNPETFPQEVLPGVEAAYTAMVDALSRGEKVRVLVDDMDEERRVGELLSGIENIEFHRIRTADVWVRDYGPIYVRGRGQALTKWMFNAWGGKYDDLMEDSLAGDRIADSAGLPVFRPGIVLEGGSVEVNGRGTLMTTEQCLLNPNRNPTLSRAQIEEYLHDFLGGRKIVWLKSGIEGDDTDGHIDDIARFVGPYRVACATEENAKDPNHGVLAKNRAILESASDQDGRKLEVVSLPMPRRADSQFGRLPASYANFYIGNAVVLVPAFGCEQDEEARETLRREFPGRRIVSIDCRGLVYGLGTLHCVTQQVPVSE
ncbi:MAG: agmatine deiminase family protein [Candidatus Gagatemarchaeaceae archaeon]